MARGNQPRRIKIVVVGSFRVLGKNEEDLTPQGRKACGLLAILALSRDHSRLRIALQDKLWSDRGREQGASSLRQALTEIRKAFGSYRGCLLTDNRTVSLDPELVSVDLVEPDVGTFAGESGAELPVLLDGLDVIRDPEFENWLRDQRSALEDEISLRSTAQRSGQAVVGDVAPGPSIHAVPKPRAWIRVVPTNETESESSRFYSRVIGEAIARGVSEVGPAVISTRVLDTPGIDLEVNVLTTGQNIMVHVSVREALTQDFLWSGTQRVPRESEFICNVAALQRLINQSTDIVLFQLRRLTTDADENDTFTLGFDALEKLFRGERADLEVADELLSKAFEGSANGIMLAWKAYLRTFLTGEHLIDREAQAEEARTLVREAIRVSPHNSHVLALASYVHSFVLAEHDVGHELAEESLKLNPVNPLGLAFLGRAKSYLGQTVEGYRLAAQARAISGPSPYRYTIEFLCGVAAAQAGHHKEAIRLHEITRALEPNYRAPLRYLMALYLKDGNRAMARDVYREMREVEPEFSMRLMRDASYPSAGLRAGGLLDVVDEEFE